MTNCANCSGTGKLPFYYSNHPTVQVDCPDCVNTVFVDAAIWPYGRMMMCHMFSKDLDSLHEMADKIGIARKWFQTKNGFPHYDICRSKRIKAVALGAVEVDKYKFVELAKEIKSIYQCKHA